MSTPLPVSFDPDAMTAVRASLVTASGAFSSHAGSMPESPDAAVSSTAVAGAMYAVADVMEKLSGELQVVADNIGQQGSIYASTDGEVRDALERAEGR